MISTNTLDDINSLLKAGRPDVAGRAAEKALAKGEWHVDLLIVSAQGRGLIGDFHAAANFYEQALEVSADDPKLLTSAADALHQAGRLREAIERFSGAIKIAPDFVAAVFGRGQSLEAMGDFTGAAVDFARVTCLVPSAAQGFAALANVQLRLGQTDNARLNAAEASAQDAASFETVMVVAGLDAATGHVDRAIDGMRVMLTGPGLSGHNEIVARKFLGDLLDKADRVDEAFEAYRLVNERFSEIHADRNAESIASLALNRIEEGLSALAGQGVKPLQGPDHSRAAGHIFLMGYPRSGNTLVEQILLTIDGVVSLEEGKTFAASEDFLGPRGLRELADLGEADAVELREAYWEEVRRAGVDVTGKTFVDMDPLKGAALPIIAKLFPKAKIILVQRDARDVVWSCYKHNFVYSPVTYEFTSLKRAVRHYGAMMRVIRNSISTLNLVPHILVYEQLIHNFDQETQSLCRYLGLPWSDRLQNFASDAQARNVRTASLEQVRKPLFDGSGAWRRYALQLQPEFAALEQWIHSPFG